MKECVDNILSIAGILNIPQFRDRFFVLCYAKAEKEFIHNFPDDNFEPIHESYPQVIHKATGTMLSHLISTISNLLEEEQQERLNRYLYKKGFV